MGLDYINKNMLKLLAISLNEEECNADIDLSNWADIYKELEAQTVLLLTENVAINHLTNNQDIQKLLIASTNNVRYFHKLMDTQNILISLLNKNDIKAVIMKGAAAAQYYPNPELRQFGDIDILILPKDYDKAFYILKNNGYTNMTELDDDYQRHIGFQTANDIRIELHRNFSSGNNDKLNTIFDEMLYKQFINIQIINIDKYQVPVLPTRENGLVLLGHIDHHLGGGGLGLRQIVDWMYFVKNNLDDDYWNNNFYDSAKAIGMDTLAKAVTKLCKRYLGLNKNITWCDDIDDSLVDDLLSFILKTGNFGKKVEKDTRDIHIKIRHYLTNPKLTFMYLNKAGMLNMKKAGLKPRKSIAWLYQIGHIAYKFIRHDNKNSLFNDIKKQKTESDLLERLNVQNI